MIIIEIVRKENIEGAVIFVILDQLIAFDQAFLELDHVVFVELHVRIGEYFRVIQSVIVARPLI